MKGGIDYAIIKRFPKCEKRVLELVKSSKYVDSEDRNIIPVGKCGCVPLDNSHGADGLLIVAPTMETPKNIKGTTNIYLAFKAIYDIVKKLNSITIVACPCLGTGIGGMSGKESALQIKLVLENVK